MEKIILFCGLGPRSDTPHPEKGPMLAVTPRLPESTALAGCHDLAAETTGAAQQPRMGAVMVETLWQQRVSKRYDFIPDPNFTHSGSKMPLYC
jgi:hypothetical protein